MANNHTVVPPGVAAARSLENETRLFVRSQLQLAPHRSGAKGRVLTRKEAVDIFGEAAVSHAETDGSFPLVGDSCEPSQTIKGRRVELEVSARRLSNAAGVSEADVIRAETVGLVVQIHKLERIAQALALDERVIGHEVGARGDRPLGVRLRETLRQRDAVHFSEGDVLHLAEAAWVVSRQVSLDEMTNGPRELLATFQPSEDYRFKAYDKGEELAHRTRVLLGLDLIQPILSLRSLTEEALRVPVIQQRLSEQFAGATVANGSARGIVLNEIGMNDNVWVRRMTLAHELGHLLWDPEAKLNRLKVHSYDDVQGAARVKDIVEMRANAFAINFLAPRKAVAAEMKRAIYPEDGVRIIMSTYGISATAAKYHVKNMTGIDVEMPAFQLGQASDDWIGRENLAIDVFRPDITPLSRRGKFAGHVVEAAERGFISDDTAATYLRCDTAEFRDNRDYIKALLGDH